MREGPPERPHYTHATGLAETFVRETGPIRPFAPRRSVLCWGRRKGAPEPKEPDMYSPRTMVRIFLQGVILGAVIVAVAEAFV